MEVDLAGPTLDLDFAQLLTSSFSRFTGRSLAPAAESRSATAAWLYHSAPFGLLAHDTDSDPRFIYANRTAQDCFEYSWTEITGLRSRLSAEPDRQADRDRLMANVTEHNVVDGYRGIRIAKSGRRFWIEDVTIWNLLDDKGVRHGQAAIFRHWRDC